MGLLVTGWSSSISLIATLSCRRGNLARLTSTHNILIHTVLHQLLLLKLLLVLPHDLLLLTAERTMLVGHCLRLGSLSSTVLLDGPSLLKTISVNL